MRFARCLEGRCPMVSRFCGVPRLLTSAQAYLTHKGIGVESSPSFRKCANYNQIENNRRVVPVPKRTLCAFAAGFGRAVTAVVIATLIRSPFLAPRPRDAVGRIVSATSGGRRPQVPTSVRLLREPPPTASRIA